MVDVMLVLEIDLDGSIYITEISPLLSGELVVIHLLAYSHRLPNFVFYSGLCCFDDVI